MKTLLILVSLILTTLAQAEDSVACYNDASNLEVVITDKKILAVRASKMFQITKIEIQYAKKKDFELIENNSVKITKHIDKVRVTLDNGSSVRKAYLVDWKKFDDGAEVPVKLYDKIPVVGPGGLVSGKLIYKGKIFCQGAQS
jgi:hypothetical protein